MAEPIEILVIGDWVVDENWVLAKHRSSFSTMEGKAHLRALGSIDSQIMTFCGAGRVARFLYWVNRFREPAEARGEIWIRPEDRSGAPSFAIFGIGTWADEDEPKLYKMFHPRYSEGINPFTLRRVRPQDSHYEQLDGLYLSNLAPAYAKAAGNGDWKEVGTTRIYRLYSLQAETPGGLGLDRRVDFELRYQSILKEGGAREYDEDSLLSLLQEIPAAQRDPQSMASAAWRKHFRRDIDRLCRVNEHSQALSNDIRAALASLSAALLKTPSEPGLQAGRRPSFRYVVVKDLGKGTTTAALLEALHKTGLVDRNTQWFISSKKFNPPYLDTLAAREEYGRLRLLILPPMAIAQMEREGTIPPSGQPERPIYKWFVGDEKPTAESLDRLEDFLEKNGVAAPVAHHHGPEKGPLLVVAMPKGLSLLAVEGKGKTRFGYYQPRTILDEVSEELSGRASMFFAALVSQIIQADSAEQGSAVNPDADEMLEVALNASYNIVQSNIRVLKTFGEEPGSVRRNPEMPYDTSFMRYRRSESRGIGSSLAGLETRVLQFDWIEARDLWRRSRESTGIIIRDERRRSSLEIWRAMDELDGYIEVVDSRRREIARLLMALKDYLHQPTANSFSAMLIARPGSGKSFLVSKLAASLGMPSLLFNVTQLISRQNINTWFDAIASAQAKQRDSMHLVFFDEINAQVEGLNVYDLFLTVLSDGTYLRGGQLFKLDPCVWVFAGTAELRDTAPPESKEPDFKNRLTLNRVSLDDEGGPAERRSKIYHGALQLQLVNPDVKKISAQVLRAFYCLPEGTSNRKVQQLATAFRNIRYGEVRAENLPEELREVLKRSPDEELRWKETFRHDQHDDVDLNSIMINVERQPESER
jgi:ATPase family associated with various cellular activities (AAA)